MANKGSTERALSAATGYAGTEPRDAICDAGIESGRGKATGDAFMEPGVEDAPDDADIEPGMGM